MITRTLACRGQPAIRGAY